MPSLALYKHKNNQAISDKKREFLLLQKFRKYDNLYNLYADIIIASKNIQKETINGIKKLQIKKEDIQQLPLKDLRYYIDYLDGLMYAIHLKSL
jgi:chorismate mutase